MELSIIEEVACNFPVSLSTGPADVVAYLYYHGSYENRPLQVLVRGRLESD